MGLTRGRPGGAGVFRWRNIAASLLLLRPESLGHAILLRAMLPFEPETPPDLASKRILIANGKHDPIIPVGVVNPP